jgi:CheY-like chemotaxis protein/HPt (histidine-containing phosphotransfer) domain-containing protein
MNIDTDWPVSARDLALREPRHTRTILIGLALSLLGISGAVVLFGRNVHNVVAEGRSREAETSPLAFLGLSTLTFVVVFAVFVIARRYITAHQRKERELECARVRAEAADSQKAELLAWVTREIRGPLTTILGQCDVAAGGASNCEIIRSNANQIVQVLDAMLSSDSPGGSVLSNCSSTSQSDVRPTVRGRVLLAEDSADNRTVIEHYLRETGVEVTIVSDGKAAYYEAMSAAARGEPFDLILMDMRMPKLDGCETTQLLRDSKYRGPIVALTANATERDRVRCSTAGHNEFLTKPIDARKIAGILAHFLGRRTQAESGSITADAPGLNEPRFVALREAFRKELPSRIDAIEKAIAAADISKAADLAHQLNGSAACYGLTAIHDAAEALQAAADDPQFPSAIEQRLGVLRDLCGRNTDTKNGAP